MIRTPLLILAAILLLGCDRHHDGKRLLLIWRDPTTNAIFRVTEAPGSIAKQNTRLHVERDGQDRAILIDDDATFSTLALVRHDHWLLVVCRGVDEVWAGYNYDTGTLHGEADWSSLPFTKWTGQGTVVTELKLHDQSASPANFPRSSEQ